jgi:hypothetical protein
MRYFIDTHDRNKGSFPPGQVRPSARSDPEGVAVAGDQPDLVAEPAPVAGGRDGAPAVLVGPARRWRRARRKPAAAPNQRPAPSARHR